MKNTPADLSIDQGTGADSPYVPIPRTTVNRLTLIQHKIRKSGLLLVDVAEFAGLRFSSVYALIFLGLVDHADLAKLERLFSEEVRHV
jgi:hypothetical protein